MVIFSMSIVVVCWSTLLLKPQKQKYCFHPTVCFVIYRDKIFNTSQNFRTVYEGNPPSCSNIFKWVKNLFYTKSVKKSKRPGRPPIPQERVQELQVRLGLSMWQVVKLTYQSHQCIRLWENGLVCILRSCNLYTVQELKTHDKPRCLHFATEMLVRIDSDSKSLKCISFSDNATSHVSWKVNRHNFIEPREHNNRMHLSSMSEINWK